MSREPDRYAYAVIYWGLIGVALVGAIALVSA